jgi:hypothetical protein
VFGYRLLRDADYDDLKHELAVAIAALLAARDRDAIGRLEMVQTHAADLARLSAELAAAKEIAAARMAMYEALSVRTNQLELENAQHRHRQSGLPAVAPQVVKGSPLVSDKIGASVDLFEDVGDAAAAELDARGLLHGPPKHGLDSFPAGADLSAGLGGGTPQ